MSVEAIAKKQAMIKARAIIGVARSIDAAALEQALVENSGEREPLLIATLVYVMRCRMLELEEARRALLDAGGKPQ